MELAVRGQKTFAATGGRPFDPVLPTVIFVHGAGMDHTVWALQTRYFAHRGRSVLAVDLPGHGKSEGEALSSIGDIADWLADLVAAVGLDQAALAGHSMGALAVLETAARFPSRVRSLSLLGVAPLMPVHPDLLAAAEANDHQAFDLVNSWGHGATGHIGGAKVPGLWLMGGANRLLERVAPGVLFTDMTACNAYQGAMEAATKVACPTLFVLGAGDKMTPAKAGTKLAQAVDDARSVVIPDSGHMMMLEKPDQTLAALKEIF